MGSGASRNLRFYQSQRRHLRLHSRMNPAAAAGANHIHLLGRLFPTVDRELVSCTSRLLWCTYRKNSTFSDTGWGCMHRSGQMVMCESLSRLGHSESELIAMMQEANAAAADRPPLLSMGRIVEASSRLGIPSGEWLAPTPLCWVIKRVLEESFSVRVLVADQGTVDVRQLEAKPVLLLCPVRLGLDEIPPRVYRSLVHIFSSPLCVGMVGGKPRSSFWFVGSMMPDGLLYLDPHLTQRSSANPASYHYMELPTMLRVRDLDPCLVLCFLLQTTGDVAAFQLLAAECNGLIVPPDMQLLSVVEQELADLPPPASGGPGTSVEDGFELI